MNNGANKTNRRNGFTLIEILIVVVILGILAAIVVGQFQTTTTSANASAAKSSLKVVRSQIELYRYSHGTPTSVDILVNNGNLAGSPVPPEGFQYVYDGDTGRFSIECTPENPDCPDDIDQW